MQIAYAAPPLDDVTRYVVGMALQSFVRTIFLLFTDLATSTRSFQKKNKMCAEYYMLKFFLLHMQVCEDSMFAGTRGKHGRATLNICIPNISALGANSYDLNIWQMLARAKCLAGQIY